MARTGMAALFLAAIAAGVAILALYFAWRTDTEDFASRIAKAEAALAEAEADRGRLLRQIAKLQQRIADAEGQSDAGWAAEISSLQADIERHGTRADKELGDLSRRLAALEAAVTAGPPPSQGTVPVGAQVQRGLAAYGLACAHKDLDVICTIHLSGADRAVTIDISPTVGRIATKPMRCVSFDDGPCPDGSRQIGEGGPSLLAFTLPSFEYAPKVEEVVRLDLGGRIFEWKDVPIGSE